MIKKIPWQKALLALIIFLAFVYPPSDYDLGWHLRYGQYFWENDKFLWTNTFSYTLPFLRWVNHSYTYDPFIWAVFKTLGFAGIAAFGAGFIYLTLVLIFKAVKALPLEKLSASLILSYLGVHSLSESLRSRYFSFVFLALLYWTLEKAKKNAKILYLLPPIFLVWANIHGTFTEGLLYLGVVCLVKVWDVLRQPRQYFHSSLNFWVISLISFGATFLNPFGFAQLQQAFEHATSQYLKLVQEYAPLNLKSEYGIVMIIYLVILITALFWRRKKEFFLEAIPLLPFLYLAFGAIRNIAVFIILSLPLAIKLLRPLTQKLTAAKVYVTIFPLVLLATFTALVFRLPPFRLFSYSWEDYCQHSSNCSEKAAEYVNTHPPKGRGLTYYDWGGYLNWRAPNIKTFIDGRMHLWQTQGYYIMDTYMQLIEVSGDWEKAFHDFDFTWVMLPPGTKLLEKINLLVQAGLWEKTYDDGRAVIYIRQIPPPQ